MQILDGANRPAARPAQRLRQISGRLAREVVLEVSEAKTQAPAGAEERHGLGRGLFAVGSTVSVGILLAALLAWPISYWSYGSVDTYQRSVLEVMQRPTGEWESVSREHAITIAAGGVQVRSTYTKADVPGAIPRANEKAGWTSTSGGRYPLARFTGPGTKRNINRAGFQWLRASFDGNDALGTPLVYRENTITLPLWFVIAVAVVLPALWVRALYRRRWERRMIGRCGHCGYDLRATPAQCPECGETSVTFPTS
jgi:hypothetical protein